MHADVRNCHLGYGTNAKLQLQFGSRLWNSARRNWPLSNGTSYADTGYQTTWDVTRAQRGVTGYIYDYSGGSVGREFQAETPYAGADSPQVRAYADRSCDRFEPVFPGFAAVYTGTATLSVPVRDPNLLGSYSCWLWGSTRFSADMKACVRERFISQASTVRRAFRDTWRERHRSTGVPPR